MYYPLAQEEYFLFYFVLYFLLSSQKYVEDNKYFTKDMEDKNKCEAC